MSYDFDEFRSIKPLQHIWFNSFLNILPAYIKIHTVLHMVLWSMLTPYYVGLETSEIVIWLSTFWAFVHATRPGQIMVRQWQVPFKSQQIRQPNLLSHLTRQLQGLDSWKYPRYIWRIPKGSMKKWEGKFDSWKLQVHFAPWRKGERSAGCTTSHSQQHMDFRTRP